MRQSALLAWRSPRLVGSDLAALLARSGWDGRHAAEVGPGGSEWRRSGLSPAEIADAGRGVGADAEEAEELGHGCLEECFDPLISAANSSSER